MISLGEALDGSRISWCATLRKRTVAIDFDSDVGILDQRFHSIEQ